MIIVQSVLVQIHFENKMNKVCGNILSEEFNGYKFKFINKQDYPRVLAHFRENFYQDEPMHQILGITAERIQDLDEKVTALLELNHGSFLAYPKGHLEQIAAVVVICHKGHGKGYDLPNFEPRSPLTILIKKTMQQLRGQFNIHQRFGLEIYTEINAISTDRDHRRKGLGTEMYQRAITMATANGHELVASTFSNPLSRKIGENLGFESVSKLDFNDVVNDNGQLVYGDAGNGHFITETILKL